MRGVKNAEGGVFPFILCRPFIRYLEIQPMLRHVHAVRLRLQGSEEGQTVAEYTVMLGVITVLIIAAVAQLSGTEQSLYERAAEVIGSLG
jgi:Flp pilus assembly pilin Flp